MRIREIHSIIQKCSRQIQQLRFESVKGNSTISVSNWINVYPSFDMLENTGIFTTELQKLKDLTSIYLSRIDNFIIDSSTHAQMNGILQAISKKIDLFNEIFKATHTSQDNFTASFKLYDFPSFADYVSFCNDLNTRILNPLNRIHEECLLGELESGSRWLSIVFKTSVAISLFFGIVRISFDCLIHDYQTYRVTKNLIESLEMSKNAIDEFKEKMHEQNNASILLKTESLLTELSTSNPELFENLDEGEQAELQNSLILSVNLLMKHIDKGLEVYEALDKPQKERYELPDFKQLMIAKSDQKKITE